MTYSVTWTERAVSTGSRFLSDDAEALAQVMAATDLLTNDPRPADSFPYGSEDLRRIRVGRYRVLYEIYPADQAIMVLHVSRVA
jgi:mRNA interferase RelE/StbE